MEILDDLLVEDRRGQETVPAVHPQVKVNVATINQGRCVEVGNQIALAHLLSLTHQDELLIKTLGRLRAHRLDGITESVRRTRLVLRKAQVDAVTVIAAIVEVRVDATDNSIRNGVDGRVVAGFV